MNEPGEGETRPFLPPAVEWILAVWCVLFVLIGVYLVWEGAHEPKFGEIAIAIGIGGTLFGLFVTYATRNYIRDRPARLSVQVTMAILGPPAMSGIAVLFWGVLFGGALLQARFGEFVRGVFGGG